MIWGKQTQVCQMSRHETRTFNQNQNHLFSEALSSLHVKEKSRLSYSWCCKCSKLKCQVKVEVGVWLSTSSERYVVDHGELTSSHPSRMTLVGWGLVVSWNGRWRQVVVNSTHCPPTPWQPLVHLPSTTFQLSWQWVSYTLNTCFCASYRGDSRLNH